MIGRLTGTLYEKMPPRIGLDVQGVGYEIDVSMTTFYALPELGAQVTILTHLTVREDAHILFGFSSAQERAAFRELVKVSGIGARTGSEAGALAKAVTAGSAGGIDTTLSDWSGYAAMMTDPHEAGVPETTLDAIEPDWSIARTTSRCTDFDLRPYPTSRSGTTVRYSGR